MSRATIKDYKEAADKSYNFIKERLEEQIDNFCSSSGDVYDKYLYHCTLDAHRDGFAMFVKRSTMYVTENIYNNYVDFDDLKVVDAMVKERLIRNAGKEIPVEIEIPAAAKYDYMKFFGPGVVKVKSGMANEFKDLIKVGKIKIDISRAFRDIKVV